MATIFLTSSLVIHNEAVGEQASGKPAWEVGSSKVCGDRLCSEKEYSESKIPTWIKNNAKWWSEGKIGDSDFVSGIQYLINNDVIIAPTTASSGSGAQEIPNWIKNNAGWWADSLITEDDFVKGIQYLVEHGIIRV